MLDGVGRTRHRCAAKREGENESLEMRIAKAAGNKSWAGCLSSPPRPGGNAWEGGDAAPVLVPGRRGGPPWPLLRSAHGSIHSLGFVALLFISDKMWAIFFCELTNEGVRERERIPQRRKTKTNSCEQVTCAAVVNAPESVRLTDRGNRRLSFLLQLVLSMPACPWKNIAFHGRACNEMPSSCFNQF